MAATSKPSAARIANEFTVNSNPADVGSPIVAGLDNGSFLVAWSGLLNGFDGNDDSNYSDIIGRVFAAGARPVGDDFRINRVTVDAQFGPSAVGSNGTFIVGYSSGEENRLPGTYAASQVLSHDGSHVGPEVFDGYSYYNYGVATGGLPADNYVVTATQEYDFEARVRNADGSTIADFHFGGTGSGGRSSVATLADGSFQLFWVGFPQSLDGPDSGGYGFYTQRATAAGLVGTAIRLGDDAVNIDAATLSNGDVVVGGAVYDPTSQQLIGGASRIGAIAALDDGGFVQVSTAADADGSGVYAQVYDANGTARGSRFLVNEVTASNQTNPDVAATGNDDFVVSWTGPDGIKAAAFSADGPPPEDAILVNTTTEGAQQRSVVARLANGGFVIVWQDTAQIGFGAGAEIRAQVFDALGNKLGSEFLVNAPQVGEPPVDDFNPAVTGTRDGGFTIAWSHGDDDLEPAPNTIYRHYAADGTPTGPAVDIPGGFATNTRVAEIGGGRTVVMYRDEDSQIFINGDIYNASGKAVGHFSFDDRWALSDYDLAGLSGGGFVVTYAAPDEPFSDQPRKVHAATYSATGALISDLVVADATGHDQVDPDVAALGGNRYVVTWTEFDGTSSVEHAQVMEGNGTKVGEVIAITGTHGDTDVAALPDGRFVATWTSGSGGATTIHSQVFTQEGDRSGAEQTHVVPKDDFAFYRTAPSVSAIGDHDYVVTFTGSGTSGDGSGTGIRAELYTADQLITGSAASETLTGSASGDTIHAQKGDDIVDGNAGNDLIYGDGGVDTVHGGTGDDLVYGGFQNDRLFGDEGADTIVGEASSIVSGSRAGGDAIDGGAGNDDLFGDAYTIHSGGFGGRDTIRGGDGNDTIWGDARTLEAGAAGGNDVILGGAGDDVIYGDGQFGNGAGGNDRITGGTGADNLWRGGGDDTFVFDSFDLGDDTIHDFGQVAGNRDHIDLRGLGLSFDDLQIFHFDDTATFVAINTPAGGETIELVGAHELTRIDFLL